MSIFQSRQKKDLAINQVNWSYIASWMCSSATAMSLLSLNFGSISLALLVCLVAVLIPHPPLGLTELCSLALNSQPFNNWIIGAHQMPVMWIGPKQNLKTDKHCWWLSVLLSRLPFIGFLSYILLSAVTLVSSPKVYVKSICSKGLNSEIQTLNWR